MGAEMFTTIVFSLLSALVSSFLAAYLTYRYTELSWRKRRHLEDLKKNCLTKVLAEVERFEEHFTIYEDGISNWVREPRFLKEPPSSAWCILFSFGFDKPPTTHYRALLHDLKNHFPKLVVKLKEFERLMRKLCPLYDEKLYELTKRVFSLTSSVSDDVVVRSVLTEVVVMSIAGYDEWSYPNDKRFLEEKKVLRYVSDIISKVESEEGTLVREFIDVRNRGIKLVREAKKAVIEVLHSNKLLRKCQLY